MTEHEEHTEIGKMYVERETIERQLVCINNKLRRFQIALENAQQAIAGGAWKLESSGTLIVGKHNEALEFPTPEELSAALQKRNNLESRLAELEKFFSKRGAS